MISRFFQIVVLILLCFVYWGSCSRDGLQTFYRSGLAPDDYRFGDLYRLSNLPQFKARPEPCPPGVPETTPKKPVHLYIIGDSFTEEQRIGQQDFPVQYYRYVHWDESNTPVQLDTAKTNILILESVERHFREHFAKEINQYRVVPDTTRYPVHAGASLTWRQRMKAVETETAAEAVEERLDAILFNTDWAYWFKELKAGLTLNWFDRVNQKVALSPDKQHLFYVLDTDTSGINSSFTPLPDSSLNKLVDSANLAADHYRRLGFDQVFLSIIPNKVTIEAPQMGVYNRLIDRVQRHPRLRLPVIDLYTPMRKSPQPVYQISDSHWNCEGRALWLREVHRRI